MANVSIRAYERLERRALRRASALRARAAYFECRSQRLIVVLRNGIELAVPRKLLLPLPGCRIADITTGSVSPAGYYLRWPCLNAYLWIGDLLALTFSCEIAQPRLSRVVIGSHARRRRHGFA